MTNRTTRIAAVVVIAALFTAGCGEGSADFSKLFATSSAKAPDSTEEIPAALVYDPPEDGSGWPSEPLDQPRPFPGVSFTDYPHDVLAELGPCGWIGKDLLDRMGWDGGEVGIGPPCVASLRNGKALQIFASGPYGTFTDTPDELAVIRPIEIAGLEAREYTMAESEEKYPGTCQVAVNTRSITALTVYIGTGENSPAGTPREPQCELARRVATMIVEEFMPLLGGKPSRYVTQQPDPALFQQYTTCELIPSMYLHGAYQTVEGRVKDDDETGCFYSAAGVLARAWVATNQDAATWHTKLPRIGEDDVSADAPLGDMPGRVQLGTLPDANVYECAQAVFIEDSEGSNKGSVVGLRFATGDERRSGSERCKLAQEGLSDALEKLMDS